MTDRLGRLLIVTLEAARVDADRSALDALRSWLDSWRGIQRDRSVRWRTTGMEHSSTSATDTA